jgi:hypothetical protein
MGCATASRKYKDSQKVGVRVVPVIRRYTLLPLKAMEGSMESVGTAARCVDIWQQIARNAKGSFTVVALTATVGAISAQTRSATSVA